jgi:DNA polymerase III psi subunit
MWQGMIANDEMKRNTLVLLKDICKALNLPISGTKAVLEERIANALKD